MTEILQNIETTEEVVEEIVTRKNPFCVIGKYANEHCRHDLQINSAWSCNPYGDDYI